MPQRKNLKLFVLLFSFLILSTVVLVKVAPLFNSEVKGAESDPVLVDLMMDKEEINTENAADSITVYARIRAVSPREITNSLFYLGPISNCEGDQCSSHSLQYLSLMTEGCTAQDLPQDFSLDGLDDCGDATDGIYSATIEFPQYSSTGVWWINDIDLWDDVITEAADIPISSSTLTVSTESGDRDVSFTNTATTEDVEAPVIEDYAFDKESIDTTDNSDTITMYLRLSDNLSGVYMGEDDYSSIVIPFIPENEPGFQGSTEMATFEFSLMESGCDTLPATLDVEGLSGGCGDNMDGIYEATVEIPRYSTGGAWNVHEVYIRDLLENSVELDSLEASFTNASTQYDSELPTLKAITITPEIFNTAESAQTVTIEMEIEDDMSGLDYLGQFGVSVGIWSIYNVGAESYYNGATELVSGTITDGTFRTEIEMPQGIAKGFWRLHHIDLMDNLGRIRRYTTADLSLAFPGLPLYLINQGTTEQVELTGGWTLEDWPFYQEGQVVWPDISVRFPEGTVITKRQGGVFAFHRMLATKYDLSTTTGVGSLLDGVNSDYQADLLDCDPAEGCTSTAVGNSNLVGTPLHIIKIGIPGLNLTFSKPVTIIVGMEEEDLGSTFIVQSYDEETGTWTNHGNCTVAMVDPISTESGGTGFGEVRPVSYPGCSFTTDHASFFSTNVLGLETEEEQAGVPRTGLGGIENSLLAEYFEWLR
jgi:hypothetical protein